MSNTYQFQCVSSKVGPFRTEGALRIVSPEGNQTTYGVMPHYSQTRTKLATTLANFVGYTAISAYMYFNQAMPKLLEIGITNSHLSSTVGSLLGASFIVATGLGIGGFGTSRMTRVSAEKAKSYSVDSTCEITADEASALKSRFKKESHAHNILVRNCIHYTRGTYDTFVKQKRSSRGLSL